MTPQISPEPMLVMTCRSYQKCIGIWYNIHRKKIKFSINDTHRGKTVLLSSVLEWLLGCFLPFLVYCTINQVLYIPLYSIITYYEYRFLKNVIRQIDSKNEWFLLSASFTAKYRLVFVLTLESAFF